MRKGKRRPVRCPKCGGRAKKAYYVTKKSSTVFRYCRKCRKKHNKNRDDKTSNAARRARGYFKDYWLRKKFGLTLTDLKARVEAQNGRCPICMDELKFDKRTHVDHDHKTGKIRDVLCQNCNLCIGLMKDDPQILRNAADYIEYHRQHQ